MTDNWEIRRFQTDGPEGSIQWFLPGDIVYHCRCQEPMTRTLEGGLVCESCYRQESVDDAHQRHAMVSLPR
jgi:hypothetical protein